MNIQVDRTTRLLLLVSMIFVSGCAGQKSRATSSVVDYLYPEEAEVIIKPSIPTLTIPLKVGIAFVPERDLEYKGVNNWSWTGSSASSALTESNKTSLLEKVAANFKAYEFVSQIEVIPSTYLTAGLTDTGGGFKNLEKISTMYGIDVIALVSYDQVQFTDEDALSLTYWTIVGAYVITGEKNDTSTMLDTVVYDIPSKKMLFRAPGTSSVKGSSTPINLTEQLRNDSVQGFEEATDEMIQNLHTQLSKFRKKIKDNPENIKVITPQGYQGYEKKD